MIEFQFEFKRTNAITEHFNVLGITEKISIQDSKTELNRNHTSNGPPKQSKYLFRKDQR